MASKNGHRKHITKPLPTGPWAAVWGLSGWACPCPSGFQQYWKKKKKFHGYKFAPHPHGPPRPGCRLSAFCILSFLGICFAKRVPQRTMCQNTAPNNLAVFSRKEMSWGLSEKPLITKKKLFVGQIHCWPNAWPSNPLRVLEDHSVGQAHWSYFLLAIWEKEFRSDGFEPYCQNLPCRSRIVTRLSVPARRASMTWIATTSKAAGAAWKRKKIKTVRKRAHNSQKTGTVGSFRDA